MRARPILFSAPMVRALLEGRKTQTRRIFKDSVSADTVAIVRRGDYHGNERCLQPYHFQQKWKSFQEAPNHPCEGLKAWTHECPYGAPGDLLWVRETIEKAKDWGGIGYPADGTWFPNEAWRWKRNTLPSIHMPRWYSRLTLELTGVRVERLQDISEEDARAEGVDREFRTAVMKENCPDYRIPSSYRGGYANLWCEINGTPGKAIDAWGANPWVWVLEFSVHKQNINEFMRGNGL